MRIGPYDIAPVLELEANGERYFVGPDRNDDVPCFGSIAPDGGGGCGRLRELAGLSGGPLESYVIAGLLPARARSADVQLDACTHEALCGDGYWLVALPWNGRESQYTVEFRDGRGRLVGSCTGALPSH